jgi:hypothetical protein
MKDLMKGGDETMKIRIGGLMYSLKECLPRLFLASIGLSNPTAYCNRALNASASRG